MRSRFHAMLAPFLILSVACQPGGDVTGPASKARPRPAVVESSALLAVTPACGASVVADLKLGSDMVCPGDALVVDADGIEIDLNGHTIAGSAVGNGITVRARHHVTIHGGTVAGFLTGIFVATSNHVVIRNNGFTQNREAVFLNGSTDNVVKENVMWQNQLRGVMLRPTGSGAISTRNLIVENILSDNPVGILLFGQPGNTLKENAISASSTAAIDLTGGGGMGTFIKENLLSASAAGIRFGVGWSGNSVMENWFAGNVCALQGATVGNTLTENVLVGNTSNSC